MASINIQEVDKNFKIDTNISRDGLTFLSCLEKPFALYGVKHLDGKFRRLPEEIAKSVNDGVLILHANTAGGRVRFKTNSPYVAIKAEMPTVYRWTHFAMTGSSGFDLYVDNSYNRTFVPPFDMKNGYESVIDLDGKEHEILIHFPLYSEVSDLYIGLKSGCHLDEPTPYKGDAPIVYYGSSITQGGCAARAGMSYQSIISRRLNRDHINLGFSGNAMGEQTIAEYIATLPMSAFVMDYDNNAPTVEHLADTHEKFFLIIRNALPELPVVFAARPQFRVESNFAERAAIVRKTYENALARGDKNVYLVTNEELTALCGLDGSVDSSHPTDLGFMSMANAFCNVLEKIFD